MLTTENSIRQAIGTARRAGAVIPKPIEAAVKRATEVSAAAWQAMPDRSGELLERLAAAVEDGRDPAADPEVTRLAIAMWLHERTLGDAITGRMWGQVLGTIRQHVDALLGALAKPGNKAAQTLTRAHETLGDVRLDDSASILAAGPDHARAWADAAAANQTLHDVSQAWVSIARDTHAITLGDLRLITINPGPDWLDVRSRLAAEPSGWDAVRTGATPGVADSVAEMSRRLAYVRELEQNQRAKAEQAAEPQHPRPVSVFGARV